MDIFQQINTDLSGTKPEKKDTDLNNQVLPISMLDAVPLPLVYLNKNFILEYVNQAYADLYDLPSSTMRSKYVEEFMGADIFKKVKPYLLNAINGKQQKFENEINLRGKKIFVSAVYTPYRDENDKVIGVIAIINDLTEQKENEKKIAKKQHELQDYFENATVGLHWVDGNGIIIWANQSELDMLGYTREEYIGEPISRFHVDQDTINEILRRLKNNEAIVQQESKLKCKDGSVKTVLINSNVLWENGEFKHTRCFTTDITERKKIQETLEISESNYRKIFNEAPAAFSIYRGPEFIVDFINEKSLELTGAKREDILNKPIFSLYPELEEQGYKHLLENIYQTGEKFEAKEEHIKYHVNDEMREGWFHTVVEPLRDTLGNITGIISMGNDITEQVLSRKKIEEKEQNYKSLLSGIPHAIYTCDKKGTITYCNDIALQLWGDRPTDSKAMTNCGFSKCRFLKTNTNTSCEQLMYTTLKTGESLKNVELLVESNTGVKLFLLVNINPLFDKEGNPDGAINIFQDITESKKTEEALKVSEEKYRKLIHVLPAAVYTTDKNGIITLYNKAAAELWGRKPEIGKDIWCGSWKILDASGTIVLPHDKCPMAICLKEGRKISTQEIFIAERPDGTRRYFQPFPEPIYDQHGNITGAINMLLDLTERKNAEEEKARLASIVETSDDAIYTNSPEGIITSWNKGAEKLYGYTEKEIIGKSLDILIPEGDVKKIIEPGTQHFETKRVKKDGSLVDVSISVSPIVDPTGNILGTSKIARNITQQKQIDRELHESNERLRMALESTKMGTWEFDLDSNKLIWSAEAKLMYGLSIDAEVIVEEIRSQNHPDDQQYITEEVSKAMNPDIETDFNIIYRIFRKNDNEMRWVKVQGKVFFMNRKPLRFIGTMLDITDEKKKEQELKDSIELFTIMAENVPAMIWMSGDDKFSDYFNTTWLDFTGRTLKQEINEGWLENVHPDDVQKCISQYQTYYNEQKGFYIEYRLKRHDGHYRWIADNSAPRFTTDGKFAGFISACLDIDDQKNSSEKIQQSELMLNTISNVSPVGLWMTDVNAQNIFVNETWIQWTGIPLEQNFGTGWLQRVIEEDQATAPAKFLESMSKKEKYTTEFRIINHEGEMRWCLTEGSPYYDINGDFAGYAGSVTDITEMKRMESRKDDFIKMASHELKTPITSIKGYVQLVENIYEKLDESKLISSMPLVKNSFNTISKQVTKLTRLVSELLDLSRIESGKLGLNKTKFSLGDLVDDVVQDARLTTTRHTIDITKNFDGHIYADKDRIAQVVLNLLANAIKYSPNGDPIHVQVKVNNGTAVIEVTDKGIGVDKKDHYRIFERFYRVEGKSEQTYPGFGIGLFIVNEIIQRHCGIIKVESEKGNGSKFIVELPITKENE